MATQVQLAIRRDEAYQRIDAAAQQLAEASGLEYTSPLALRHRDPQIEQILRIEHVAATLEALTRVTPDPESKRTPGTTKGARK